MAYQIYFRNKSTGDEKVIEDFTINNRKTANIIRRNIRDKLKEKKLYHIEVKLKRV